MAWAPYVESVGIPKTANINTYRKAKIKMLQRDFCIKLTEEELKHVNALATEIKIDQFCLGMINKRWN